MTDIREVISSQKGGHIMRIIMKGGHRNEADHAVYGKLPRGRE